MTLYGSRNSFIFEHAELVALCAASCQGVWLTQLLKDLGTKSADPVVYYEDNQSTIRIVQDERYAGRLKHVDVKHRYILQEIQQKRASICYIPTGQQLADIFTKGLSAGVFRQHRTNLGLVGSGN